MFPRCCDEDLRRRQASQDDSPVPAGANAAAYSEFRAVPGNQSFSVALFRIHKGWTPVGPRGRTQCFFQLSTFGLSQ